MSEMNLRCELCLLAVSAEDTPDAAGVSATGTGRLVRSVRFVLNDPGLLLACAGPQRDVHSTSVSLSDSSGWSCEKQSQLARWQTACWYQLQIVQASAEEERARHGTGSQLAMRAHAGAPKPDIAGAAVSAAAGRCREDASACAASHTEPARWASGCMHPTGLRLADMQILEELGSAASVIYCLPLFLQLAMTCNSRAHRPQHAITAAQCMACHVQCHS